MKTMNSAKKKSHPNTIKVKQKKSLRDVSREMSPWMEEYEDFFTHRMHPVSELFLEKIGSELIEFAETSKVLRIEWFFTQKRIPPQTARNWASKSESFAKTYQIAKHIIGMRREEGMLSKRLSESGVLASLHMFDPMFEEIRAANKQDKIDVAVAVKQAQEGSDNRNVTVVFESAITEERALKDSNENV